MPRRNDGHPVVCPSGCRVGTGNFTLGQGQEQGNDADEDPAMYGRGSSSGGDASPGDQSPSLISSRLGR